MATNPLQAFQALLQEASKGASSLDELADRMAEVSDPPDLQALAATPQPSAGQPSSGPGPQPQQPVAGGGAPPTGGGGGGLAQLLAGATPGNIQQGLPNIPGMEQPNAPQGHPFIQQSAAPAPSNLARLLGGG